LAFCKEFNAKTQGQDTILPVEITIYADKSFTFILKTPPAAVLVKKEAGIEKGSGQPNRNKVGSITRAQVSLYVLEVQPASYAILAANEAEKAAEIKVVDYRMIGATGRVYLSGEEANVRAAGEAAIAALEAVR